MEKTGSWCVHATMYPCPLAHTSFISLTLLHAVLFAQGKYGFRGANADYLMRSVDNHHADVARLHLLDNYRSYEPILRAAEVIQRASRFTQDALYAACKPQRDARGRCSVTLKQLPTGSQECQFVVDSIKQLSTRGIPLSEIAVLYRYNSQVILKIIQSTKSVNHTGSCGI